MQGEEISNKNEHNSVKDTGERGKKNSHENLVSLPDYFSFHLILRPQKAFLKTFPTKMKPTKCPTKEKISQEKRKKGEGEIAKS